jgi:hypothetical protein
MYYKHALPDDSLYSQLTEPAVYPKDRLGIILLSLRIRNRLGVIGLETLGSLLGYAIANGFKGKEPTQSGVSFLEAAMIVFPPSRLPFVVAPKDTSSKA